MHAKANFQKVNSIAPPHPLTIIGLTLYGSVWFLKCAETLVLIFFAHEKMKKKPPLKVGYFSKMAEMCALEICSTGGPRLVLFLDPQ